MKTARYTYCLYSLLVGLLLTSCGAESILRKADQSYALGEYNEAAALFARPIDWRQVEEQMEALRCRSLDFLRQIF